jgi:hypothetical protein
VAWRDGQLVIRPNLANAAHIFGISRPSLYAVMNGGDRQMARADNVAAQIDDDAVTRIIEALGPARVLHIVDKLTAPELSLEAAE